MPKYMCEHSHTSRKQLSQSVPARAYPEHVEGLTSSGDKHFETLQSPRQCSKTSHQQCRLPRPREQCQGLQRCWPWLSAVSSATSFLHAERSTARSGP